MPQTNTPVTIRTLQKMRMENEKIAMLTCYDATFAAIMEKAGVDVLLIGDSLGMVIQGQRTTLPVTLKAMAYHVSNVARGTERSFIVVDMPFASFQESPQTAFKNAAELMAAGAHMVKIEGGEYLYETIAFLTQRGIPVCGHIGLTPQSVNQLGGFVVQGKDEEASQQLIADALACQNAGASLLVIEAVPSSLGQAITNAIDIPTIGIGAGPGCSGQVLVAYDMLGMALRKLPRFVKNFLTPETPSIAEAITAYVSAVKSGSFPGPEHCFKS